MKKYISFVLVLAFVLLFAVSGAAAQGTSGDSPLPTPVPGDVPPVIDPGDVSELPDILSMLAGPAGWISIGVIVSTLFAKWPWYNSLASGQVKHGLFVGTVAGVSIVAYILITYVPASVWEALRPFWMIIAGTAMSWASGTNWHKLLKRA